MLHCKSIAPKYGVTPKTIRDVWSGRSWAKTTRCASFGAPCTAVPALCVCLLFARHSPVLDTLFWVGNSNPSLVRASKVSGM